MATPAAGVILMRPVNVVGSDVLIPVNPERFQITQGRAQHGVDILGFREVLRVGNRRLDTLEWSSFFPALYDSGYVNGEAGDYLSPTTWVSAVNYWMDKPVHFAVTISGTPFYAEMVVEDFSYDMEAGDEIGEIGYTIRLRQFIRLSSTPFDITPINRPPSPSSPVPGTTYTIVSGDTLWGIAKSFYGYGSLWPVIWEANKPMTSGNPNLIYPGEVIVIPPA